MKFPPITIVLLVCLLSFETFATSKQWEVTFSQDEMTGDFSAYTTSPFTKPLKQMDFPYSQVKSWIGVGCDGDSYWVYLGFNSEPHISRDETRDGFDYIRTRIKWDDEVLSTGLSKEWGARFIHFNKDDEALSKIKSSHKLKVELSWYKEGMQYFEYDLSGAKSSIEEIMAECSKHDPQDADTNENDHSLKSIPEQVVPIVRIDPKYPLEAISKGLEGSVVLSFTINEVGGVEDILVISSPYDGVFDKESRRALRKWKFKPAIVDGKPIKQFGMTVTLDFKSL